MNEDILLTITMLVSDRVDTIEKCMRSLTHLREAVSSELIVVDTAGNQTCMDIVRQYTDKIVRFDWCNDFSAARNAGVKMAKGKWLMFLDDDEWFESTEEIETFFLSGDYRNCHSAAYLQRNYHDAQGIEWKDTDVVRLVEMEAGTRFVGRIHEILWPSNDPTCYLNDFVHHYGYVYKTDEEKYSHSWRNIRLLLEARKENPNDYHNNAQLIQEYRGVKENFNTIELCMEMRSQENCWTNANARYTTYAMMAELDAYFLQERYADGCEAGREMLGQRNISILAKGIVCHRMVLFCYYLKKYGEALDYIDRFFQCVKE